MSVLLLVLLLWLQVLLVGSEFVVRVNTFRRPAQLTRFLEHYARCPDVSGITVVWADPESQPPGLPSYPVNVSYEVHSTNSLSHRFRNLTALATEGVLSIDDDVIISCSSLAFAYGVWRTSRRVLVGFSPRVHGYDPETGHSRYFRWQHTWWNGYPVPSNRPNDLSRLYSIVLTKACFLHRDFLMAFQRLVPDNVLKEVDQHRNGEDLAMAHVVAQLSRAPPVWVKVL